jgi:hypothetical protein
MHRVRLAGLWLLLLTVSAAGFAAEAVPYSPSLAEKSRCTVAIDKLRPTQFCVGFWEVEQRGATIAKKKPAKLKEYLDGHLPLIVIGPQGVPYLVDGHHLCAALLRSKVATQVEARVEANYRDLEPAEFWKKMQERGWVYPYDAAGKGPLDVAKLPKKVADLTDDPYRSLAWAVRERGGWEKVETSFAEFRWAQFFRTRVPIGKRPGDFERAVEAALKFCHTPEAKDLPGFVPANKDP